MPILPCQTTPEKQLQYKPILILFREQCHHLLDLAARLVTERGLAESHRISLPEILHQTIIIRTNKAHRDGMMTAIPGTKMANTYMPFSHQLTSVLPNMALK